MIIGTSTIEQIRAHLHKYDPIIQERLIGMMEGHDGRDIRKGLVKRWPVVKFGRFVYDHNTYIGSIGYKSKRDYKNGNAYCGLMVEYETEWGKQLAAYTRRERGMGTCVIISNHAIRRVRERLHWEDADWYTLVQRIIVMMDGAEMCPTIHRYGDPTEISYGCIKGEFCGKVLTPDFAVMRTFIGKEQMAEWRQDEHQKAADWYAKNIELMRVLRPAQYGDCLSR